eukprot:TRINITY_DN14936_c0_g3_i1.p1 TRINITY_DN14936_c0_g3~~TRINITY_DN14936_c0_g3_i1.p1  ORF type:complete len:327 (+),score=50.59 TRINITY_DN14936_c0_g3_i1:37-1017(+)
MAKHLLLLALCGATQCPGSLQLRTGVQMPVIGFGTAFWEACGEAGCANEVEDFGWEYRPCRRCMADALGAGYRAFDLAELYDGAEEAFGEVLKQPGVARDGLFLTSKVGPSLVDGQEAYTYEQVLAAFNASLARLRTNYLDLYLLHWHALGWKQGWKALEAVRAEGRARAIGVSNFDLELLRAMHADPKLTEQPSVVQNFMDPVYQSRALRTWCSKHGIAVTAYSTLSYLLDESLPLYAESRSVIGQIAHRHNKSVAQVLSRWMLHEGVSTVPKTRRSDRMIENLEGVFEFNLNPGEVRMIRELDQPLLDTPPSVECTMLRRLVVC